MVLTSDGSLATRRRGPLTKFEDLPIRRRDLLTKCRRVLDARFGVLAMVGSDGAMCRVHNSDDMADYYDDRLQNLLILAPGPTLELEIGETGLVALTDRTLAWTLGTLGWPGGDEDYVQRHVWAATVVPRGVG